MADINLENSIDVLLIGRAGNGKSSTGNTIIGKDNFFASSDTQSSTKFAQYDFCEFDGKPLKVVDCPGLGDTRVGVDVDVQQLSDAIETSFEMNPKGFNAIIYILNFANKFDHYDVQALSVIKEVVGEDFINNHCILLMTRGDCFETDPDVIREKLSFEGWVERQKGNQHFYKTVKECKGRIVLFNNRETDPHKKQEQMRKLVELIERLGDRYTNKDFEKAAKNREQLLAHLRNKEETLCIIDKINVIGSRIKQASNDEKGYEKLMAAGNSIKELKQNAEKAMENNKTLRDAIKLFEVIETCLNAKLKQVETIIDFEISRKAKEHFENSTKNVSDEENKDLHFEASKKGLMAEKLILETKNEFEVFEFEYLEMKTKILRGFHNRGNWWQLVKNVMKWLKFK